MRGRKCRAVSSENLSRQPGSSRWENQPPVKRYVLQRSILRGRFFGEADVWYRSPVPLNAQFRASIGAVKAKKGGAPGIVSIAFTPNCQHR
jgi:hypothetical protein